MNTTADVIKTHRVIKQFIKIINKEVIERDRSFLNIMLGWIECKDGKRRVLTPSEFKTTYCYVAYRKHNQKYNDEFLKPLGIELD